MPSRSAAATAVLVLAVLALVGCSDSTADTMLAPGGIDQASTGPILIECPINVSEGAEGTIGATGGSVRLRNHELRVPPQAVTSPRRFGVYAPVSNYMEISALADGQQSFQFRKTATIVIDYSRCTRSNVDGYRLTVWQIDPDTKALIGFMGGVDDKENRTVTFETDHLSTFSIAR